GLPGTVNFVGEFTIFMGAVREFPVLAVIGIFGIIITAVYSLRLIANVLFGPRRSEWDHLKDLRGPELVPLVVLVFVIVYAGVFPNTVLQLIDAGIQSSGLVEAIEAVTQAKIGGLF
ncbi:MAG: NADH-quinone oxidoreductase subunit M, partial [Desulfitobacterium sp.]|nr:NADH-quinone oxidoreductase subunit M [Desulfitobacterium sp.]